MSQISTKDEPQWANPGALGLAAFGLNTVLLQIHNIGWIDSYMPLIYGIFWGGIAQVIAGIIDGKRGDTFGLTAFCSYGLFWIGIAMAFVFQWTGVVTLDNSGLAWTFIMWAVFTFFMMIGTLKMTFVHFFVFASLVILFGLLAAHKFGAISAVPAGIEGLFCGAASAYGAAAVIINGKFGRTVLPMGRMLK
ncbi:MAG: acetate uptake transporter [Dehalococcoidales bacterium]|nr:acetate uptake transporter [Dehalococcoidales bacterium]